VAAHYIRLGLKIDDFISHDQLDGVIGGGRKNDPHGFDWDRFRTETQARLVGEPVHDNAPIPHKVWSDWFGEYLIVVSYVDDNEWYFVTESNAQRMLNLATRASSPLSRMPRHRYY